MAKIESNFKNMVLVLSSTALISAFLLAFVYNSTFEAIEQAKLAKQQKAIKDVLPEFDRYETIVVNDLNVYKAYKDNRFVGAAVESFSNKAFSGNINVMVGFNKDGNIHNYVVLEQKETPGLGTKIVNWFKTDKGNQSIIHKNPKDGNLKLKKDGGEIDAITAATISSRAFMDAITRAYNAYAENPDAPNAVSGATQASHETEETPEPIDDVVSGATTQEASEPEKTDSALQAPAVIQETPKPVEKQQKKKSRNKKRSRTSCITGDMEYYDYIMPNLQDMAIEFDTNAVIKTDLEGNVFDLVYTLKNDSDFNMVDSSILKKYENIIELNLSDNE